jgi:hypothetical protein
LLYFNSHKLLFNKIINFLFNKLIIKEEKST